jgi:hypothetical protein
MQFEIHCWTAVELKHVFAEHETHGVEQTPLPEQVWPGGQIKTLLKQPPVQFCIAVELRQEGFEQATQPVQAPFEQLVLQS